MFGPKLTIEDARYEFEKRGYTLLETEYINARTPMRYTCHKHPDIENKITLDNLKRGHGCKQCGIENRADSKRVSEEKLKEMFAKRNYTYICREQRKYSYSTGTTYIKYICNKHPDEEQWISYGNFLNGYGCKHCNESHGERKIREFLKENNINYTPQKRFQECRDKNMLPFDFYLPDYNLCIEFQGKQHCQPVNLFGKISDKDKQIENYEMVVKHDQIKKKFCEDNDIKLLCIYFFEIKEIENILRRWLDL